MRAIGLDTHEMHMHSTPRLISHPVQLVQLCMTTDYGFHIVPHIVSGMNHISTYGRGHPKMVSDSCYVTSMYRKRKTITRVSLCDLSQLVSPIGVMACVQGMTVSDM